MPVGPESFSPEPNVTKPDYPGAEEGELESEEADREREGEVYGKNLTDGPDDEDDQEDTDEPEEYEEDSDGPVS